LLCASNKPWHAGSSLIFFDDAATCKGGCLLHLGGNSQTCGLEYAANTSHLLAHLFHIESATWQRLHMKSTSLGAAEPSPRHSFAATSIGTASSSRPAFVISGGANSRGVLMDTWVLELELADGNLYAQRHSDMPAARMGHTLTSISLDNDNSSVILVGGAATLPGEDAQLDVWLFEIAEDKWMPADSLPEPRAFHSAVVSQSSLFVWAGSSSLVRFGK
jgi:hypothetical protein